MAVLYIVLMPKLFWENVNGDGAQAFEVSRLLLRQPWPFFPASVGPLSHFPDMTSLLFAYPNAWFMRLFGELDVAVRLPFLLYLLLLAIGIQAVAEERGREVGPRTMTAIWLGLITFALAMAFSATYSPYSADIALPAPRETLLMLCFVGFVHAMIRRDMRWVGGFGLLTYTTLPTGLLLMVFWLAAEVVVMRPIPIRVVSRAAMTLLGCIVLGIATKMILVATGQPPPGVELGPERAFRGLLRLNVSEWRRIVYALVACGIFPFVALAVWRRQDDVARRVTLVTLAYLAFFYVQSRFALHHLVPAMVLPAIVAARLRPEPAERRQQWLGAWQGLAILSVWLPLPASFEIELTSRRVGMAGVQLVGDYRAGDLTALRAGSLLQVLFPFEWDPDVPVRSYGGSALAWQRYTRQGPVDRQAVFVLAPIGADGSHPSGRQLATADGNALYILDEDAWLGLRNLRSRADRHAKVYEIPQSTLFGAETENIIDLRDYGRKLKHLLVGPPTP